VATGEFETRACVCDREPETCNGADDDCDGDIDEGVPDCCNVGDEEACGTDVGECVAGTRACRAAGTWGECEGAVEPALEICDGLDNDCDPRTNDGAREVTLGTGCDGTGGGEAIITCESGSLQCVDVLDLDDCPSDPDKTMPGICGCGVPDTDSDDDGTPDCVDDCPADPERTDPGGCGCGVECPDDCPTDPDKTTPGACGCGVADTDSDDDDTPDCLDDCPVDPDKTSEGACGCGVADTDSDGDDTPDCDDDCPSDPNSIAPGRCGCGGVAEPPEPEHCFAALPTVSGVCTCNSCADCTAKLADAACGTVRLTTDLSSASSCVAFGLSDKVFDCQDHAITGTGTGNGIAVVGVVGSAITRCRLSGWENGIYADGIDNDNWVLDLYVLDVDATNNTIGFMQRMVRSITARNSHFDDNSQYGLRLQHGGFYGCYVGNTFDRNGITGYLQTDSRLDYAHDNDFSDNGSIGLATPVRDCASRVTGNRAHRNGAWAFQLYGSEALIADNHITGGGGGISGRSSSPAGFGYRIVNNVIENVSGQGIFVPTADFTTGLQIRSNTITGADVGIHLGASTSGAIEDNVACDSGTTDIVDESMAYTGDRNTCDTVVAWSDASVAAGCASACP
jgi:hypothetical protein